MIYRLLRLEYKGQLWTLIIVDLLHFNTQACRYSDYKVIFAIKIQAGLETNSDRRRQEDSCCPPEIGKHDSS
jgi:hypothetical protein